MQEKVFICYNKLEVRFMKKKKLKLRKRAYVIFFVLILMVVGSIYGYQKYKQYLYEQTYEYKLLTKGYSMDETKYLESNLDSDKLNQMLEREKDSNIILFMKEKYFLYKHLDEYLDYYEKNDDTSLQDVVALINTHANNRWYSLELDTDISLNEVMNVNKFYKLSKDYKPDNLVNIPLSYAYGSLGDNKMLDYAYDKFMELWNAAHEHGYYLMVTSSYRDYKDQEEIYEARKKSLGERKADELAARPGNSEHQTGLVIDMTSSKEPFADDFTNSEAYKWLKENAYRYGFIERYPEGKTYITGYSPESWHWRYVGVEAATVIHNEGITFDEYYAYYVEK